MRTFSALASNSMLSSVGEYTSFAMLLIVDFEIPVIMDSCRTEMFLSYIILFNNIFMFLLWQFEHELCTIVRNLKMNPNFSKDSALVEIEKLLDRYSGTKKEHLLSSWLIEYSRYLKQEETFKPQYLKRYKRGEIIKVNLGYRIGCEEGGPHYAIVLDKSNSPYSDLVTILPLSSKKESTKLNKYVLDLGNEVYTELNKKYLSKFQNCIKSVSMDRKEDSPFITLSVGIDDSEVDKVMCELKQIKEGSIALLSQITSVSKIRIMKPLRTTDPLSNVCISPQTLDLIDSRIKDLYLGC